MAYRIQSGDTLSAIAQRFHTSVGALLKANPSIKSANLIHTGQQLQIPGQKDDFVSTPSVPQHDLQKGSSGAEVKELQKDLVKLGFLSESAMNTGPGTFGPKTLAALKEFQKAYGVSATGYYGPQTRTALAQALRSTPHRASNPAPRPTPTPAPKLAVPPNDLQKGSRGAQVKQLQADLVRLGFMSQASMNTGAGIFGQQTQSALRAFQAAWGVPSTGYYGPLTRTALTKALAGDRPTQPAAQTISSGGHTAADIAKEFLGWTEYRLQPSGRLPMDKWVPKNVDCANFVSACLQSAGKITKRQHSNSVVQLAANLRAAGWRQTDGLRGAQPGDVVCIDGPHGNYQHVEIFAGWVNGRPMLIGSNNRNADGTQSITYDSGAWAYRFHVFHK